tara:strand:+ start:34 stop:477 length:444 start_codon:yes stop_codon:yes gene_type:complete
MSKDSEWLEIDDLDKFTNYLRTMVYINFNGSVLKYIDEEDTEEEPDFLLDCDINDLTDDEKEELNNLLALSECVTIVKDKTKRLRHKKTKEKVYLISIDAVGDVIEDIQRRFISNMISILVKKGYLDSAFDEDRNDFIFWTKNFKED